MIGIGLVTFVTVFAEGLRVSFEHALDTSVTSDLIIQPKSNADVGGLSPATARAVGQASGAGAVSPLGFQLLKINHGGTDGANGVDPATITKVYRFDWRHSGNDNLVRQLGGRGALVEQQFADAHHLSVGERFDVTSQQNRHATLVVRGIYHDPQLMSGFVVANPTLAKLSVDPANSLILVKAAPGVSVARVEASVKQALKGFPTAKVQSNGEYKQEVRKSISQLLNLLYALLAISVIIALFGIVNTLVLTIYERTREIGMLRAIGMTRSQMRSMIRYESVMTSIMGGLLGIATGVFFGWIMTKGLQSQGIEFALPVMQLIVFLVVAAIAGVLAAAWPARRASRLDVLNALQYA
jgi:putative ABC transport system permease protein